MTVKELEAKVKMLEQRIAELEDDNKEWLWDPEMALNAAFAIKEAFHWDDCPYKLNWEEFHNTLMQIAREGKE